MVIPSREDGEGPRNLECGYADVRVGYRADVQSLTPFGMTEFADALAAPLQNVLTFVTLLTL